MKNDAALFVLAISIFWACNTQGDNATNGQPVTTKTDTMTYATKNISVSINKPATQVYQFASDPANFPKWVAFIESITKEGDTWLGKTDLGDIRIRFSPINDVGILDHQVTLPTGETVSNPLRVIINNKGSEVIFTLFHLPTRTDEQFNEDAMAVTADLKKLKEIMEGR